MKTINKFIILVALLMSSLMLKAQTTEPVFFVVEAMKATPNKSADYVKNELEVWKKLHQERVKRGLILSWTLYQVNYPSGTNTAYDYVTVTAIRGFNGLENPYGTLFTDAVNILSKEEYARASAVGTLRNLTSKSVFSADDYVAADPNAKTPPKYLVVNYMKVKDNKWEEYKNFETKLIKPMHVELMKAGGRAAWGLYGLQMPGGDGQPYDYTTVDFFNKWSDMTASGSYRKALEKVHPGTSYEYMMNQMNGTRSLVNSEVWEWLGGTQ